MSEEIQALKDRVANLEQTVAQLQPKLEVSSGHWIDRFRAGIKDAAAFDEAMRLGREFRKSFQNDDDRSAQS